MSAIADRPHRRVMIGAGLCLALLVVLSLAIGVQELSLSGTEGTMPFADLMAISRLPRTLAAVLCGAGLAVAGQIMQTLTRNRFVERHKYFSSVAGDNDFYYWDYQKMRAQYGPDEMGTPGPIGMPAAPHPWCAPNAASVSDLVQYLLTL